MYISFLLNIKKNETINNWVSCYYNNSVMHTKFKINFISRNYSTKWPLGPQGPTGYMENIMNSGVVDSIKKGTTELANKNAQVMVNIKDGTNELINKNIDVLHNVKDGTAELKNETIRLAISNAIFILKESEQQMISQNINNMTCGVSINIGPISVNLSKIINLNNKE